MKKIHILQVLIFTVTLAGCVDTIDTVSRQYRNTTNEAIDALTMVTTEADAVRMTKRVFKPLSVRYAAIDKKLSIIYANADSKKEFAMSVLGSDNFILYEAELRSNNARLQREMTRLKHVEAQYIEEKRQEKIAEGEINPVVNAADVCPALHALVSVDLNKGGDVLGPMVKQLMEPELVKYKAQFSTWKIDENAFKEMMEKHRKRKETFVNPGKALPNDAPP